MIIKQFQSLRDHEERGGHGGGWNQTLSRDRMTHYFQKVCKGEKNTDTKNNDSMQNDPLLSKGMKKLNSIQN